MNPRTKRNLAILTVGYLLGFLFLYSISLLTFPAGDVLRRYFWGWVFDNTVILFLDASVALTGAILLLSYAMRLTPDADLTAASSTGPVFTQIRGAIVPLLVLLFIYALMIESALPRLHAAQQERSFRTHQARSFLEQADEAVGTGAFGQAAEHLRGYLAINPEDSSAIERLDGLTARLHRQAEPEAEPETARSAAGLVEMSAGELLTEALAYMEHEDYYSAHYYASLASQIDPSMTEPKRLMAFAWDRISATTPDRSGQDAQHLFERKRDGYAALVRGDAVTAYSIFSSLAPLYPQDRDIARYLVLSTEALERGAFFIDETSGSETLPGTRDIFFLNRDDGRSLEFVYIRKLVEHRGAVYAEGLEAIAFDREDGLLYHLAAPYGKLSGHELLMLAVDRTNPGIRLQPEYLAGRPGEAPPFLLHLEPEPDQLPGLSSARESVRTLGLFRLIGLSKTYGRYGYRSEIAWMEIAHRIMKLFGFMIVSLLSIGLGLRLRGRYVGRPPILLYPAFLLVPFALNYLVEAFYYVQKTAVGLALFGSGLTAAAATLILTEAGVLFASLLYLTGRRREAREPAAALRRTR